MTATQTLPRSRAESTVRHLPRRVPAPATEPPYDNHHEAASGLEPLTHGSLALDLATGPSAPVTAAQRHLSVVDDDTSEEESEDPFFAPQPTPRLALPDPRSWSGRFVQALVEVLTGDRPSAQLLRWTNADVYGDVIARVRAVGSASAGLIGRGGRERAIVRSVHVCEPCDGIAEASVHVRHGGRSRAVALRIEGLDGRWRCTALELG
ncbi:Rv3235 family protein [Actinopolymorpha alba]|uniref:Rv3235 family protein n=1 Tax=Actinopolymorpha alba TaxID=533267 RepID=UPI00037A63CA|nr:Rv3235 family protein [Actinopolymorpha alba]